LLLETGTERRFGLSRPAATATVLWVRSRSTP